VTKFCKDCKYFRCGWLTRLVDPTMAKCAHPDTSVEDRAYLVVNGRHTPRTRTYCDMARASYGSCGPDGKFWEAK
jgi:hypothetical protein